MKSFPLVRFSDVQNGLIRIAIGLRRFWVLVMVVVTFLAASSIWVAKSGKATSLGFSGLQRMFGGSETPSLTVQPMEVQGSSGGYGTISSFDAPSAGNVVFEGTAGTAINAAGTVTGVYSNVQGVAHAFIRTADGTFISFDAPDADLAKGGTVPMCINSNGDVAGFFIGLSGSNVIDRGFIRLANGTLTEFDEPANNTNYPTTVVLGINDAGQAVGYYEPATAG